MNDNYGHTLQLLLVRNCPFYLSWYMIAIYLMLMASLVATLVIHHQRRKRKRLQQEMADRQRQFEEELRQKEKEQLLGRIETQSSQLKERMRFLTMKQEILNSLSTEIEAQKKKSETTGLIASTGASSNSYSVVVPRKIICSLSKTILWMCIVTS